MDFIPKLPYLIYLMIKQSLNLWSKLNLRIKSPEIKKPVAVALKKRPLPFTGLNQYLGLFPQVLRLTLSSWLLLAWGTSTLL